MRFEWDDKKNEQNKLKHGIDFAEAIDFPWHKAVLIDRTREEDNEQRYAAIGPLYVQLHTIIFTKRKNTVRIISFRRSNKNEEKTYEENV